MDLVKPDQKIALCFPKENNMVEMTCTIIEAHDDRLVLNPPQYFMRYIDSLKEGSKMVAKIFSKIGTIDFSTVVISSPLNDKFEVEFDYNSIKLTEASDMPAVSAVESLDVKKGINTYKVKTFELSSNFLKFTSNEEFKVGDTLDFALYLPKDYGIINFKGAITDIDPIYENEYTANYLTIKEADRQVLLYYMYVYSNDVDG